MASARPSRRLVSRTRITTAAAVAALTLTGCSATNPITTAEAYNVVDGVQASLSQDVAAHNLLVFTSGEGEVGTMSGALVNHTREAVEFALDVEGSQTVSIEVPPGGTVLLGEDGEEVEIGRVEAAPGSLLTVTLSTPQAGSLDVEVPVFDGTLPEYEEIVPDPEA